MEAGGFVIAAVAVVYGVGFAILPISKWSQPARSAYVLGGAALIAVLALGLAVMS